MNKTKTKKLNFTRKIILITALFCVAILVLKNRPAISADCNILTGDEKDKCEDLEKKAEAYQKLIDLKNKQQMTLQKQMELIEAEQIRNRSQIADIEGKIAILSQEISELEREIEEKETSITYQRAILSGLMQAYYARYQQGTLNIVLLNLNFSDAIGQADYIDQTSGQLNESLLAIRTAKKYLDDKHDDLNQKNKDLEDSKAELEGKKASLQENENKKQSLLTQTQGEEAKYQQLLARVEAQKLELFDFTSASDIGEITAKVKGYPKPDEKYYAFGDWYFSQTDSRWANVNIGGISGSSMKKYGCAIASVSMVFRKYGSSIDPGKLVKQKIYDYDLIKWPGSWQPNIKLVSSTNDGNVNWTTIRKEISNKHPVIVRIKKAGTSEGHFVVIHNYDESKKDYVVHDPYFGANIYLGASKLGMGSGSTVVRMIIYN